MIVDRSTAGVRNEDRLVFGGGGGDPIRGCTAATVTEIQRDSKTGEALLGRQVPGMAFGDARTLAPLKASERPPRVPLARMLDEIRRELQTTGE